MTNDAVPEPVCQCTDVCVIPQGQPQPVASCRGLENQTIPPAASDLRERQDCTRCNGTGWLDPIGPCLDGSYVTSRPCPRCDGTGKNPASPAASDLRESTVERVARALHEAHKPWCDYTYDFEHPMSSRHVYEALARAALAAQTTPVQRLYDALSAMMYGWEDDSVRVEGFAALKEAAPWLAARTIEP